MNRIAKFSAKYSTQLYTLSIVFSLSAITINAITTITTITDHKIEEDEPRYRCDQFKFEEKNDSLSKTNDRVYLTKCGGSGTGC